MREKGTAPGTQLVQAVKRAGYQADVIPIYRLQLDCPDMNSAGCPDKVRRALAGVRGVRGVGFPGLTSAVIYYDGRTCTVSRLLQVMQREGVSCSRDSSQES